MEIDGEDTQTPLSPTQPDVIAEFIEIYASDTERWRRYLEYTRDVLEAVMKEGGIACNVTGRLKASTKAEMKLNKRKPFYQYGCEEDILWNLIDLIGLRVAAYFPDDHKKIVKLIDTHFITIARVHFEDDKEKYTISEDVSDEVGEEIVAFIKQKYEEAEGKCSDTYGNAARHHIVTFQDPFVLRFL